jgi:abequosyltransferase
VDPLTRCPGVPCYPWTVKHALTVSIPTFNRAALLDEQLAWFSRAVTGREHVVELIVSDNASTDETPEVMARWAGAFASRGIPARFGRNGDNVGAIRNIASCIQRARGSHVWVVGDDDRVDDGALAFVLDTLADHPNLALLILNFSSRHHRTGELIYERCFEIDADDVKSNGRAIVERYLADPHPSRWGGLVLTTALVYRTTAVQAAARAWPEGLDNITMQLYLTASTALQGETIVTKEPHLEMAAGRHFFQDDKMTFFRFRIAEVPEAFLKLVELGYSLDLCREKIRNQRREIRWRRVAHLFVRQPLATGDVLLRHLRASCAVVTLGLRWPAAGRSKPQTVRTGWG